MRVSQFCLDTLNMKKRKIEREREGERERERVNATGKTGVRLEPRVLAQ